MKTNTEILKLLGLTKNTVNNKVAGNYLNLIKLVIELKKDILNVEVCEFLEIDSKDTLSKSLKYYNVFEVEFLKTVKIETPFGSYFITVPVNTNFYAFLCVLLNIESNYIKETPFVKIENTIFIENEIILSIKKSLNFTDKKQLIQLYNNVVFKLENNFIEVLSTNGYALYKSQKFNFVSDLKIEKLFIQIPIENVNILQSNKNEFLQIDILENNEILCNNEVLKVVFSIENKIDSFCTSINSTMEFQNSEFKNKLKSLKPSLDFKNQIKVHLNGSIDLTAENAENNIVFSNL